MEDHSSMEKQALLESVLNNTESSIMLLKAVRNKKDQIADFEYVYTNDQTLRSVERKSLAGKRMTEEFPEVKNSDLLKTYIAVAETGQSFKGEADINPFGYPVWAQVFAQKFDDGVLVTYFDITERKKAEAEIFRLKDDIVQSAQDKYQALFNSIDEGFSLLELIFDDSGKVIDYWHRDDNPSFMCMTGIKNSVNKRMSELVPDLEPAWYKMLEQVYHTGEAIRTEYTVQQLGQWYTCYLSRVGNSGSPIIAAIYDDITERKLAEKRQQILLHIIDNLSMADGLKDVQTTVTNALREHYDAGWCYYVEWDEEKKTGIVLHDSTRDGLPSLAGIHDVSDVPGFLELLKSGQLLNVSDYENYDLLSPAIRNRYIAIGFRSMLQVSLVRQGRLISSLIVGDTKIRNWSIEDENLLGDVAERTWAAVERTKAEEALRESEEKYRELFERIGEGFCIMEVIFDGNIPVDYRFIEVNPVFEYHTGIVNGKGRLMRDIAPDHEQYWFDHYGQVAMTGEAQRFEAFAQALGNRWYEVHAFRVGKPEQRRVAIVFSDITERKKTAEALQDFNRRLEQEVKERTAELQESRDQLSSILNTTLVQMSILSAIRNKQGEIIDLEIKAVNQELEKETGRKDLVGKRYATEYPGIKQTGLFDLIVKAIETGEPQSTEYFYPHEGFNKWFTCMFVKLGDGVVATNMDISDRKRTEEQLKKVEANKQREIFEVSLSTMEEERHRISENLHNGIGQILYGAKINMAGLIYGMAQEEFTENKAYISELLTDAIKETRRISHELMPTTLEQFGLKSAIDDICRQLTDGTHFNCHVTGLHRRIERFLALAVYRTVQELMTNVVKHAKATECEVDISIGQKDILIAVRDNGQGMDAGKTRKPGIGLASIRSKIELLKGEVTVNSTPGNGTTIEVIIPKPHKTRL